MKYWDHIWFFRSAVGSPEKKQNVKNDHLSGARPYDHCCGHHFHSIAGPQRSQNRYYRASYIYPAFRHPTWSIGITFDFSGRQWVLLKITKTSKMTISLEHALITTVEGNFSTLLPVPSTATTDITRPAVYILHLSNQHRILILHLTVLIGICFSWNRSNSQKWPFLWSTPL